MISWRRLVTRFFFPQGGSNNTDNFEICNSMNEVGQSKIFSVWSPTWTVCIDSCQSSSAIIHIISITGMYFSILTLHIHDKATTERSCWTAIIYTIYGMNILCETTDAALVAAAAPCCLCNKGETNTTISKFLSPGAPLIPYYNFVLATLVISQLKITSG